MLVLPIWNDDWFDRIIRRIDINQYGCWIWEGAINDDGYASPWYHIPGTAMRRNGFSVGLHRVTWIYRNGSVPKGLELDHLCDHKECVNPDHLEAVTHQENVRRYRAKKQTP